MIEKKSPKEIPEYGIETLQRMHDLFLEALRHREQEMIRYLAILVPALGGYGWLVHNAKDDVHLFTVGTISVLLLLFLGAVYSLAIGYNFRYVILQLAKLEAKLQITDAMLEGWPRSKQDFLDRYRLCGVPWCTPPELIKVFWWTFLVGIIGVTTSACIIVKETIILALVIPVGGLFLIIGWLIFPICFGSKLHDQVEKEPDKWEPLVMGGSERVDAG